MDGYDGDDEYDHRSLSTKKKWSQLLEVSRVNASKYIVAPALTLSTVVLLGLSYYTLMLVVLPFFGVRTKVVVGAIATFLLYSIAYFYVMLLKTPPGTPPALASKRGSGASQQNAQHNHAPKAAAPRKIRKPRTKKKGPKRQPKWKASIGIDTTHKFDQFPKRDEYYGEGENIDDDDDDYEGDNFGIYNAGKIGGGSNEDCGHDNGICHKCTSLKVPRSHHCKTCGTCVLKMDHHCSWIGKCVGFYNYRYYVMFMFYVANYCFLFFIFSLPPYTLKSSKVLFFLIVVSLCLGVSVFILCAFHMILICTNQTTIEFFKNLRSGPLMVENRVVPRKSRFDFWANPYNLGEYRNICEGLNVPKNGWVILSVLPNIKRPPTGNGCTFKHSKRFQQINCV